MKRIARWALVTGIGEPGMLSLGNGTDPWLWALVSHLGAIGLYAISVHG